LEERSNFDIFYRDVTQNSCEAVHKLPLKDLGWSFMFLLEPPNLPDLGLQYRIVATYLSMHEHRRKNPSRRLSTVPFAFSAAHAAD
jgi:hypothetical protein